MYFQCGLDSLELRATLDLLEQIAAEPCFNSLRTQQQLGYSVSCGIRLTHNVLGFAFAILSGEETPLSLRANLGGLSLCLFISEMGLATFRVAHGVLQLCRLPRALSPRRQD